jgi:hypothetical protein
VVAVLSLATGPGFDADDGGGVTGGGSDLVANIIFDFPNKKISFRKVFSTFTVAAAKI